MAKTVSPYISLYLPISPYRSSRVGSAASEALHLLGVRARVRLRLRVRLRVWVRLRLRLRLRVRLRVRLHPRIASRGDLGEISGRYREI